MTKEVQHGRHLFSALQIDGLRLRNRITMAPLYLGYAAEGGRISPLLLAHYGEMAASGAALIVVENACVTAAGAGSPRTLRCDHARCVRGLAQLAAAIKTHGSRAALQINHAGRFAYGPAAVAPSAVPTFSRTPRALTRREIAVVRRQFALAALRVKTAGFDLVELHGGTGYLLSQFVSPRTNRRDDTYGGTLDRRLRFPLEVVRAVKETVGNFPVGYRLLADEWLPDGLQVEEACVLGQRLASAGVAYLSVMGGTYESFFLPAVQERARKPGYMVHLAAAVRLAVDIPVIAAGRISTPDRAEAILAAGHADLVGLARMLWVDPEWPHKARAGRTRAILKCSPQCDACMQLVMKGKPAFCPRWAKAKRAARRALFR